MMTTTQVRISELASQIATLEPLAQAERLANIAGIEDLCVGCGEALAAAKTERDKLIDERQAELLADDVRRYRDTCDQRDEASTQLSKIDAKIAEYPEQEREYFKRANDIARWTDKATGAFPQYNLVGAWKLDAYGNKLDVSPEDAQHRPVVPDQSWSRVKELRDLYISRTTVGQSLSSIQTGLRDMVLKNPALAYLKPR
jgi:hypothetical protein